MKKLNIKDIKNGMTRNDMRNIKGGCGCRQCYKCSWGLNSCATMPSCTDAYNLAKSIC